VTRRIALILLTVVVAAGLAAAWPAPASAQDNTAIAINTKDGSALFKFAFSVSRVAGDVVDNGNAAVAFASCENCQTVAIAIQIVLVTGDPDVVTPTNLALAFNVECTLCETLASAYQFVFGTGGPVHFTAEGNRALAELRREFHDLRKDAPNLTVAEIQARVAALVDRLRVVLANELVPAGRSGDAGEPRPPTTTTTTPEPTTTAEPTTTVAPTEPTTTEESTTTTTTTPTTESTTTTP
jgi:putative peptide zinc metalloprotease protein